MVQATTNATGFYAFHANHLEDLRDVVVSICKTAPLPPLSNDLFLVQSNGIAQWLKLSLAKPEYEGGLGIAAGLEFSLPSSFIWRAYRAVLSAQDVPEASPLDKATLSWRLFRMLPNLAQHPEAELFTALLQFMQGDNPDMRRFQLAQRLADLFDQYQVYRADWLARWELGENSIVNAKGIGIGLNHEQLWQAKLWRLILQDIGPELANTSRSSVHQAFLAQSRVTSVPLNAHLLPKRIIVFGVTSMPKQMLEALQEVSRFTQVVFCVVNPCQFYWADIVSDRELLTAQRKRGNPQHQLSDIDLDILHQHANPLLASLGKQGRDYIRLLDSFDETSIESAAHLANLSQIDIYRAYGEHEDPKQSLSDCNLLHTIQNDIFNLTPISEMVAQQRLLTPSLMPSIAFHEVYSVQREVEALHDQLLAAFDQDKQLQASDIIVMTPDINAYAPYIHAVFGLPKKDDHRHIPFTISDQGLRQQDPVLIAFERLLSINTSRFTYSEIVSFLELPAISEKFGLSTNNVSVLKNWIQGANIRWGLNAKQRKNVLQRDDITGNTWQDGLEAMLLGYSMGNEQTWSNIQAYAEIGGLEASLIGNLIEFVEALKTLNSELQTERSISSWQLLIVGLLDTFFDDADIKISMIKAGIIKQLERMQAESELAHASEQLISLPIVQESLLSKLDTSTINHRFMMGKVNFATLMPMRAIPFKRVYLLGMNSGDYPRTKINVDFDLMAHDYRPGDRSMREDDRYLFLEAMLSARDALYISWIGRSIKDDSERPASILVAQLQDYINKFWHTNIAQSNDSEKCLKPSELLTTRHPLQPFSPDYFPIAHTAQFAPMFTYASEWHKAISETQKLAAINQPIKYIAPKQPLLLRDLGSFLKYPAQMFYKQALAIRFEEVSAHDSDNETYALTPLLASQLIGDFVNEVVLQSSSEQSFQHNLQSYSAKVMKRGGLGIATTSQALIERIVTPVSAIYSRYQSLCDEYSNVQTTAIAVNKTYTNQHGHTIELIDTIYKLRENAHKERARILVASSKTWTKDTLRFENILPYWIEHIAGNAMAESYISYIVSKENDQIIRLNAIPTVEANQLLDDVLNVYIQGMTQVLPIESSASFAYLQKQQDIDAALSAYKKAYQYDAGYLSKAFGDSTEFIRSAQFAELSARLYAPLFSHLTNNMGQA